MTDYPKAIRVVPAAVATAAVAQVLLGYDERFLRRKRLITTDGRGVLVDLAETVSLGQGDCLELADGRLIGVLAAEEDVLEVTGDLARLAWHIGNRHTPCQIEAHRLLIRQDHVLEAMLQQLGAVVRRTVEPFTPEGGAYGHGRTMGHDQGGHNHGGHDQGPETVGEPSFAGLHHHGDGKLHFHAPRPVSAAGHPIGHKDAGR